MKTKNPRHTLSALAVALALCGCASTSAPKPQQEATAAPESNTGLKVRNPHDPWEPFNRHVFAFNQDLDRLVLKPVARTYRDITPGPARTGVNNFFNNLREPWYFVNNLLQFRMREAAETVTRFSVNTVFGIGGLIDIASDMQIERHKQDFGRTLAQWGVNPGPYVVLPLLGPSTFRDTLALPADSGVGDPLWRVNDIPWRNSLVTLRVVDTRATFLGADDMLSGAALDLYSFTRDAWLQMRGVSMFDDMEDWDDYDDAETPAAPATEPAGEPPAANDHP